ncbi:hypothetical protein [uncultured Kosakonia sp.]|uniref:hypothetical protein n=1 Tax=uncultured Kosakonia sp. TaxID=1588927 RepID=UPI00259A08E2|nr:hypothetical protein [uncultured Kosakonia sp.]
MGCDDRDFYQDDEGITTDLTLLAFGVQAVQCTALECDVVDENIRETIAFLIHQQHAIFDTAIIEAQNYTARIYSVALSDLTLIKIYLLSQEERGFGLLFSTQIDPEHGIGMKFNGYDLTEIGSAETAFL